MDANAAAQDRGRRLSTWKEVAQFFGKDERTVRRWEASRGLPVRRVPGTSGTTIFAYTDELSRWLGGVTAPSEQDGAAESAPVGASDAALPERSLPAPAPGRAPGDPRASRVWGAWSLFGAAAVLVALAIGLATIRRPGGPAPPETFAGTVGRSTPRNPRAADFYLKGSYAWNLRTPESLTEAVDDFTQAIVLDPGFAPAYVGLANCYNLLREYSNMPPEQAYPRAQAAAERAVALDDRSAEAHRALAFDAFYWSWDIPKARREFKRALELDPGSALTHHWYATFLSTLGESERALREIDRAEALDPGSGPIRADKAAVLMSAGHMADAAAILTPMAALNPGSASPHAYLAVLDLQTGDDAGYVRESRAAAALTHDAYRAALAEAAARGLTASGRTGMLERLAEAQRDLNRAGHEPTYELAKTYAALHRTGEAITLLRAAVKGHEPSVTGLHVEPTFAYLHGDRQFQAINAAAGFPDYKP